VSWPAKEPGQAGGWLAYGARPRRGSVHGTSPGTDQPRGADWTAHVVVAMGFTSQQPYKPGGSIRRQGGSPTGVPTFCEGAAQGRGTDRIQAMSA